LARFSSAAAISLATASRLAWATISSTLALVMCSPRRHDPEPAGQTPAGSTAMRAAPMPPSRFSGQTRQLLGRAARNASRSGPRGQAVASSGR
jgi:hypothetical protein